MDASKIQKNLIVHAKGAGTMQEASGVHIGVVESVEDEQFVKLAPDSSFGDGDRWFPIDWVESVDEKAVYLSKTENEVKAGLVDQHPQFSNSQSPAIDTVTGGGVD